ncbi:2-hydroxyacid dehydrogenase [Bradyrhizobium sp. SZCCHNS1054]|uniref:2-hydroxyacid dehydrogenase n=1 Tax=Bradyrhizobium sp. SZCCHNS1054 TaxID=3057301 RepID=UPI002916002B|nr:NAD(P)-dependent oxidoreductase [Bradyrhizobium sp. SZCCHNS1054]
MKPIVLITGDFEIPEPVRYRLDRFFEIRHLRHFSTREPLVQHLSDASYYVLGGPEYADAALLERASSLKKIIVMGTGIPSFVNEMAAAARGIMVYNTPSLNCDAVAEFALGVTLLASASVFHSSRGVHSGTNWCQTLRPSLGSSTIGIVGLGEIGARLAQNIRALSADCQILYWSRSRKPDKEGALRLQYASLFEIFSRADQCSICLAYDPVDTHHLIGRELLGLGRGVLRILQFSNPNIIDGHALRKALEGGDVAFAFMDGYYREWTANGGAIADEEGLLGLGPDKFVATSHKAALTREATARIVAAAAAHLLRWRTHGI